MTTSLMHRTRNAANASSASEVSGFASPSEKVRIVGSKVFITGTDKGLGRAPCTAGSCKRSGESLRGAIPPRAEL